MGDYRQLLEIARNRLNDMLRGDDGQAWKEAQRFVDGLDESMAGCDKQAEPVAWMKCTRVDANWDAYDFSANQHGDFITPLYTHPAQPVQPAGALEPIQCPNCHFFHATTGTHEANPAAAINEQLLKDAERYRWLRDSSQDPALVIDKRTKWVPEDDSVPGVGGYWEYEYRSGEELDLAIDAAIAAAEAQIKGNGL